MGVGAKDILKSADWKAEKHVPVIEVEGQIKKGSLINFKVSVGKEIPHPNTTEHHISWISVYFLAREEKFAYQILRVEFASHGASTQGPNTSSIYSEPVCSGAFKCEKSGSLIAVAYCNIHGLWESSQQIEVL